MMIETKRDVFDEVRYKFRNFKNEHRHGMYASPDSIDHYLSDALKRYDAALPDDLPVIPFRVAEVIKTNQADTELTIVLMRAKTGHQPDDYWINNHQNTFARTWTLGVWRVEETGEIVKLEEEK